MGRPRQEANDTVATSATPKKKQAGYDTSEGQKAIQHYIDGAGFRRTGRQLGVGYQSGANWVKEHAEHLPKAAVPAQIQPAECDEIFTFIGDQKTEST